MGVDKRIVAVIPARGGSVSIPKKNIKRLAGRPLIDWVIQPALHSGIFAEVWVSTDDDEIADIALASGAKVRRLDEPSCLDRMAMPQPLQKPRDPARRSTQASLPAKVHRRAAETATSTASTESALIDFVSAHPDYDVLCLIQATSPLIVPGDFTAGWQARASCRHCYLEATAFYRTPTDNARG